MLVSMILLLNYSDAVRIVLWLASHTPLIGATRSGWLETLKWKKFHVDQRESLTPKTVVASASRGCSRRILGLRPNGRHTIPHRYRLMASYTLPRSGAN